MPRWTGWNGRNCCRLRWDKQQDLDLSGCFYYLLYFFMMILVDLCFTARVGATNQKRNNDTKYTGPQPLQRYADASEKEAAAPPKPKKAPGADGLQHQCGAGLCFCNFLYVFDCFCMFLYANVGGAVQCSGLFVYSKMNGRGVGLSVLSWCSFCPFCIFLSGAHHCVWRHSLLPHCVHCVPSLVVAPPLLAYNPHAKGSSQLLKWGAATLSALRRQVHSHWKLGPSMALQSSGWNGRVKDWKLGPKGPQEIQFGMKSWCRQPRSTKAISQINVVVRGPRTHTAPSSLVLMVREPCEKQHRTHKTVWGMYSWGGFHFQTEARLEAQQIHQVGAFFALSGYVAASCSVDLAAPAACPKWFAQISVLRAKAYTTTENAERAASPKLLNTLDAWTFSLHCSNASLEQQTGLFGNGVPPKVHKNQKSMVYQCLSSLGGIQIFGTKPNVCLLWCHGAKLCHIHWRVIRTQLITKSCFGSLGKRFCCDGHPIHSCFLRLMLTASSHIGNLL